MVTKICQSTRRMSGKHCEYVVNLTTCEYNIQNYSMPAGIFRVF